MGGLIVERAMEFARREANRFRNRERLQVELACRREVEMGEVSFGEVDLAAADAGAGLAHGGAHGLLEGANGARREATGVDELEKDLRACVEDGRGVVAFGASARACLAGMGVDEELAFCCLFEVEAEAHAMSVTPAGSRFAVHGS